MTTLQPRAPYTKEELKALYPQDLELEQVQILLRHGERTPVKPRFPEVLPALWPFCRAASNFRSAVLDPHSKTFTTFQWRRHLETFHQPTGLPVSAKSPKSSPHDICDMGTLTDVGRQTTHSLGERLRNLYITQLDFLPKNLRDTEWMYLRSTPVPRALESLQQVFHGLYPESERHRALEPPTILMRNPDEETLFPNDTHCARFKFLTEEFGKVAARNWNFSREVSYINRKIGIYMPQDSRYIGVDSKPSILGILDTINATRAHGPLVRMPEEFYDPDVLKFLEKIALEEWFKGYAESREYRTLGVGSLMGDVVSRMLAVTYEKQGIRDHKAQASFHSKRLGLSGCHDTTIAGVLVSLGVPVDKWPPFTSHIAMELFSTRKDATLVWENADVKDPNKLLEKQARAVDGWYVRLRYNDEPVTLPGCKLAGNHLAGHQSFCTLDAFKRIVGAFTPRDWKKECKMFDKPLWLKDPAGGLA